jgi:K+-transporting ATPase ATPase C chain
MTTILRPAIVLFMALSVICGVLYPFAITGIAQVFFSDQAGGSLVAGTDRGLIGSSLIGQAFTSPRYFRGRPSATSPMPNNAVSSGGSNLGPTNRALIDAIKSRVDALKAADPDNAAPIPVDLVTASASGLDPEISLAAAYYQAPRIARERKLSMESVRAIIDRRAERQYLGFFGEPRVNVLLLNLALDAKQ